jgi:hypothetical protein
MYVSGVLFGYVVLVIVCAAFLVAICWSVHSLFYRDHFATPLPMRAPQLSYMRDVRQRELQQLVASNDGTAEGDEKNFHDDFVDECTYFDSKDSTREQHARLVGG